QPPTSAPAPAPTTTSTVPARPAPGALVQAPSNITGVCDHAIQAEIDAALDGSKPISEVIAAVEPRLWNMATVLPILQDTTIVAVGPSVTNVSLTGAVPVGIVGGAGNWVKLP
ncbi:monoacyl phosphatidylinositol tetramannoside-binding protein, partial [Mycolicibacter arupensis]